MIKEAIEKIAELALPLIHEDAAGNEYAVSGDGKARQIRPEHDRAEPLGLTSLDALVKMVRTEALTSARGTIYIEAGGVGKATCFLSPDPDMRLERPVLYEAAAADVPGWGDDRALAFDEMLIALRTRFQPTDDAKYLLQLLSEITCGAQVTFADNGIATTIMSQKGVALKESTQIRPIVTLKPYRTFHELDQPEGQFLLRLNERSARLIEADGGMWRLHARAAIAAYLEAALEDHIKDGRVVVML